MQKNLDPAGFYAALNVSPDATRHEIRLAYELMKMDCQDRGKKLSPEIQAAYDELGDPQRRQAYGKGRIRRGPSRLNSVPLLVVVIVFFMGVVAFLWAPTITAHFTTFDVGDELYWKRTTKPLGVVLEYDVSHHFDDDKRGPAYRIQPTAGPPMWYPALDVNRHCARR